MRKILILPILLVAVAGCQGSLGEVKKNWYTYHQVLGTVQYEVVTAAIEGRINETQKAKLYAMLDTAIRADIAAKQTIMAYEEGKRPIEMVQIAVSEVAQLIDSVVNTAKTYGLILEGNK